MKKLFGSHFNTVLILMAAAMLTFAAVYPEIFLTFKTSFVMWSDYCVEYAPTFVLTTFFYQGGVQLWDFFGQMPYFHTFATLGLFKFPNVVTAVCYYLLAPFSEDSAALFHHVFAWGQLMTLLFIRVIGIYLLLKTVTKNRIILMAGTVIFAVFFSPSSFLVGVFYRSYLPLAMYFVVRFFQSLQARFLIAGFLFLMIVLGNEPLHGGYLYLPIHFFIIAGILWRIFFNPISLRSIYARARGWRWRDSVWIILAAVFILAPYAYIVKFGLSDLVFGQADSRIAHPFDPQWYFHHLELALSSPNSFFRSFLNLKSLDEYYIGISFIFLALAGFVLSQNTLKWIFAISVAFLWLLTFPRESFNLGSMAHWINALTNPLKTLPRSYFNAFQPALAFMLMPLAAMGIEAVYELYKGKKYSGLALCLLGIMISALLLNVLPFLPSEEHVYLILCAVCLLGAFGWVYLHHSLAARRFLVGSLCFFVVIDILFIIDQSKRILVANSSRKPVILDAAPQSGLVELDFENPSIFPYRNTCLLHFSFKDEQYLWWPHSVSCDLHHVINQGLNYVWVNGFNPRHVEFAQWLNDPQMLNYLKENNEFIFLAPAAINASPDALSRIAQAGLARQVVAVEDPWGKLNLPDQWPSGIRSNEGEFKYDRIEGTLDDSQGRTSEYHLDGDLIVYRWHLPSHFPDHLASSWFLAEQRYLRFFVEGTGQSWQELQASQGALIRPNTFDVQNIKQGELRAAFSKDDFPMHRRCVLLYPSRANQGVEGLWVKQFDNLGIIYRAKKDGWLTAHYPYDTKFKISVDGKQVKFYRTNKSFIGFPLAHGEHKILIQYWPRSLLRILLLVSACFITLGLLLLIVLALRWEQKGIDV